MTSPERTHVFDPRIRTVLRKSELGGSVEGVGVVVDVVDVVVVVTTRPRWERATCQISDRPDLAQVYATLFTVRDAPTLVHLLPRISGVVRASAGMARCTTSTSAAIVAEMRRFTTTSTNDNAECDNRSIGV